MSLKQQHTQNATNIASNNNDKPKVRDNRKPELRKILIHSL